jgi:hypothetical protein
MSQGKPPPRYKAGQELAAPGEVVESGRLKLVGREWGQDNKFCLAGPVWVYLAIDACGSPTAPAFCVTETELAAWNEPIH